MTNESPYAPALADLRKKRAEIDNTIKVLEAMSGLRLEDVIAETAAESGQEALATEPTGKLDEGAFLGMSIVDAAKKLLGMRKRQMGNPEIAKELAAGGLVMNSADPVNTVGSVLTRRFNNVGDVVKVARGTWGLKEWYPNRSFKPANKQNSALKVESEDEVRQNASHEAQRILEEGGFVRKN